MNSLDNQENDLERLLTIWKQKKKAFGLTQEGAAKEFGFKNASAISQYLTGHIPLNPTINKKFADFLGVPLESISPTTANFFEKKITKEKIPIGEVLELPETYEIVKVENNFIRLGYNQHFVVIDTTSKSIDSGVFAVRVGEGIRALTFSPHSDSWRVLGASDTDEMITMTHQHVALLNILGKVIYKISKTK